MTVNDLVWKHLLSELYDDEEVLTMSIVSKDSEGNIHICGVDDYGYYFKKEERK